MIKEDLPQFLGRKIKEARNDRNMTQEQLGKKLGVYQSEITRAEKGIKNMSVRRLYAICQALSIDISDIFKGYK